MLKQFVSAVKSIKQSSTVKKVLSAGLIVAAIVGFLSDGTTVISFVKDVWRHDEGSMSVLKARLKPYRVGPTFLEGTDDVFLQVQLRNYGKEPAYLTSAHIQVVNSDTAIAGRPGVFGRCVLTDNPNANTPIRVDPGATVWLRVSDSVRLPGLAAWLSGETLKDIHVPTPEDPFTITENFFVSEVNRKFEELFGLKAAIELTLYSGNRDELQTFNFKLGEGKDIFAKDGSLQHDWFIANWMFPKWGPASATGTCQDEPG